MGLTFATDLDQWQRWQDSRHPLRHWRGRLRRPGEATCFLHTNADSPRVLVALDSVTPSSMAAFVAPIQHLEPGSVAVLAPVDVSGALPGSWAARAVDPTAGVPTELREMGAVLSSGHFLRCGGLAFDWAQRSGARFVVVQHGLITPFAPPLPPGAHVFAFSDRDAEFWASGRSDISHEVIGSQLFWDARRVADAAGVTTDESATPVFLGQLHGSELPRAVSARSARQFCLATGASYRPHPAETDRLSRLQHALWRRRGIDVDTSGSSLAQNRRPVVSIFSTGVLETAAAGIPAWVTCADPPPWLREFWDRYGMAEWGGGPTPSPAIPEVNPAEAVARSLTRIMGETS